jgi:hypothetical protein
MGIMGKPKETAMEILQIADGLPDHLIAGALSQFGGVLMDTDAGEEPWFSVEKNLPLLHHHFPEPDPVPKRILPDREGHGIELGALRTPQFRPGRDDGMGFAVAERNLRLDGKLGNGQAPHPGRSAIHGEIHRNGTESTATLQAHEPPGDHRLRGADQRHVPIDAPIVEPIGVVRRHSMGIPLVAGNDDQAVCFLQAPGHLHAERRGASFMQGDALAVEKHVGLVLHRLKLQERPLPQRLLMIGKFRQ